MHCDASRNKKEKNNNNSNNNKHLTDSFFISHMNLFKQKMAQTERNIFSFHSFCSAEETSERRVLRPSSVTVRSLYTAFPSMPLFVHAQGHARLHRLRDGGMYERDEEKRTEMCGISLRLHGVAVSPKKPNAASKNSAPGGKKGKFSFLLHVEHSFYIFTTKRYNLGKKIQT